MKYKVGDKVRVREDLIVDQWYGYANFCSRMYSFEGQTVTIKIVKENKYLIEEDSGKWNWTDEMFSGKASEDFITEEPVSQNTIPEEEKSSDIITVKPIKAKLLLL